MSDSSEVTQTDKVLVVDDSATNRALLGSILKQNGYKVDASSDGKACVEYCEEQVPQLILLDVMMPHMNGIEVCEHLRAKYSKEKLPIIFVTTKAESEDVVAGIEKGGNDYVTKPIDRKILLARVENQLIIREAHIQIEEQKRSVERALGIQQAMGDVLPEALVVHDQHGDILYSNHATTIHCNAKELNNVKEVFSSIYQGVLEQHCQSVYNDSLDNTKLFYEDEIEVANVQIENYRISSRPVFLDDGTALRVWVWKDLTPMRELERKINQQIKMDTVSLFAAGVAHNFNNMMGSILGATDLLERLVAQDAKATRIVSVVRNAVEKGSRLTKKMYAIVKGDLHDENASHDDLLSVVQFAVDVQSAECQKQIDYHIDIPEECYLNLSMKNLEDIISEVLSNAVDAIEDKGEICFIAETSPEASFIKLYVKDNGCGMDSHALNRVFEPFYSTKNLDERNNVSMVGNGLGLWNVYNLVKMIGGDIEIHSSLGTGTEVCLKLPLYQSDN